MILLKYSDINNYVIKLKDDIQLYNSLIKNFVIIKVEILNIYIKTYLNLSFM